MNRYIGRKAFSLQWALFPLFLYRVFKRKVNGHYHFEKNGKINKFLFCSLSFLQHPICTIKYYYLSICSKFRDWWHPIWCNKRQAPPFSCLWSMSFANVVMIKLLQIDPLDKVIYTKHSKRWPYTVAHTFDCVCRKC